MFRKWISRSTRHRAVSTMIGGIIVLTLLLSALGAMVFVSQQYDAYQQGASKLSQRDIDRFSENLGAVYPGLNGPNLVSGLNQYIMTVSNLAGIGIQVTRIYINSTGAGCTTLCILDAANAPIGYSFRSSDRFFNPSEYGHNVTLWLPSTTTLPTTYGANTVAIVTARGRVFSFQYPFPPVGQALQSGAAVIATGTMKIAYTWRDPSHGYNSQNEGTGTGGYCHLDTKEPVAGPSGTLYFINPWVRFTIMQDVGSGSGTTTLYIYAKLVNSKTSQISIKAGNLILVPAQSGANSKTYFIGGTLVGTTYLGTFYPVPSSPMIPQGGQFILIFKVDSVNQGPPGDVSNMNFMGTAAVTNMATDGSYYGATVLLDGLYVPNISC